MKWSLSLGKIAGIKVNVHWTFLILIGWVILSQAYNGAGTVSILWMILFVLSLFGCVTLHELGHALAARRYHFETLDITLLPIGGLARLEGIPEKPSEELIVAAAGPAVNGVIAGLLYLWVSLTGSAPEMTASGEIYAGNLVYMLMQVNVLLVVFNLIPAFPMDGGRMFRAVLAMHYSRTKATRIAASAGQMLAILFVFIGLFYNPFLVLIGIFVYVGTLSRKQIIEALSTRSMYASVREAMNPEVHSVSPDMPLETLLPQLTQKGSSLVPVLAGQQLLGVIDVENLTEFLMIQEALHKKTVGPIGHSERVSPGV